jgi:signal transduction histidine kinase
LGRGVDNSERVLITAQGETIPILKSVAPIILDDREYLLESFVSIAKRKHAEDALQQYTRELEASNAELDAFAHTVAHDLKNPLTAMIGLSGMLQAHYARLRTDDVEKRLDIITRAGHRMTNIINELLLLSSVRKMEEVESSPLDMSVIVADARERIEYLVENAQAEIIAPKRWPVAMGYTPWIEEVWANYISNAIKYGGQPEKSVPPRIIVGATEETGKGTIRFWVRDNGAGLPPGQQAKLFAPFERLGQAHAEGHGLGLSIVRRIVEKLGGEVGVESEVGKGSTFFFTLPAADVE